MCLMSCQTKQTALNDLRTFAQELQIGSQSYGINDWKDAGVKYYKINKRLTKHAGDYSDAEIREISELNGTCARTFSEGAVNKIDSFGKTIKSFLDGFLK